MELVFVRLVLTMGVMSSSVVLDNGDPGGDRSLVGILLTVLINNGKKSYSDPEASRCWRCSWVGFDGTKICLMDKTKMNQKTDEIDTKYRQSRD